MNTPIRHARSLRPIHARIAGSGPEVVSIPGPLPARPDAVEPGVVLFGRFCVIGGVWQLPRGWRVRVTDLERTLGDAPHHRLDLHVVPTSTRDPVAFRVALGLHAEADRRILAFGEDDAAVALVTPSAEGRIPRAGDAIRIGQALASLLAAAHARGLAGWRFDPCDLRVDGDRWRFDTWSHLDGVHFGDEAMESR